MKRFCVMAAVCAVAACGGKDSDCDFTKISGTYKAHFSGNNGNCNDLPDVDVLLTGGDQQPAAGCVVNNSLTNEEACTSDADVTCAVQGGTIHEVTHLDVDADGSHFDGTTTVSAAASDGESCLSTYNVSYDRQ